MRSDVSPENEQFIQSQIASGSYHNRGEVMDAAVDLLREQKQLLEQIDEGTRQLRDGEVIELSDDDALLSFADEIKRRGRERAATDDSGQ